MLSGVHFVRNYIFVGKVNFEGSWNDYRNLGCGGRGAGCRGSEDGGGARIRQREKAKWAAGGVAGVRKKHRASGRRRGERGIEGRERGREAVIKSDCIASRMSQESRISGDVKPCLTPQLDNCGCGS